ncbi:hypothetical protein ACBR55_03585 [Salinicoccus roseus]|uniref:hypothetical protein n=1 Tax=Salinicoccus roseus TaxID=45670 RepID=UPI0035244902
MKVQETKFQNHKMKTWTPYFIIACGFIGATIGSFLAYFIQGEFPYSVLIGAAVASFVLCGIQFIKQIRKKDRLPEADERTIKNLARYFAATSHLTVGVLFISLTAFTLIGYDSVPLLYLWILFFSYIWIGGIGAIIVKRR